MHTGKQMFFSLDERLLREASGDIMPFTWNNDSLELLLESPHDLSVPNMSERVLLAIIVFVGFCAVPFSSLLIIIEKSGSSFDQFLFLLLDPYDPSVLMGVLFFVVFPIGSGLFFIYKLLVSPFIPQHDIMINRKGIVILSTRYVLKGLRNDLELRQEPQLFYSWDEIQVVSRLDMYRLEVVSFNSNFVIDLRIFLKKESDQLLEREKLVNIIQGMWEEHLVLRSQ